MLTRSTRLQVVEGGDDRLARAGRRNHAVAVSPVKRSLDLKAVEDLLLVRERG